jgi:hypothetical protein
MPPPERLEQRARRWAIGATRLVNRRSTALLQRLTPELQPRVWSNRQIEAVAAAVSGDVVHVSAWRDDDKEGRRYRDYFGQARSYATTNVGGLRGEGAADSILLDLAEPLDPSLRGRFDLVFNHTTLEHVYALDTAIANLCALSRSDLLLVVPFMQVEHWERPSYGDFWRIGAHGLRQACIAHGFEVLSLTSNHNPAWPIYYCLHARRLPDPATGPADLWAASGEPDGFGYRPVEPCHPLMA